MALLAMAPLRAAAQDTQSPGSVPLGGRVLDAYVGGSLEGAEVALVPYQADAELPDSINDAFLRRVRYVAARTAGDGTYRFADVPPGVYLLSIRRPGYKQVVIRVNHAEIDTRVSVALELEPIVLQPVEVKTRAPLSDWTDVHGYRAVGTLPVERLRQRSLLASDARVISAEDVRQSSTLAEADVFRALQRLPGVSTRDDWSAELWTRGASWGETRVYLDGLPLFNPLHAFGMLSGMTSHGIGAMVFQPGVRSAAYPEGAAAVVDLSTRSGDQAGAVEGGAEATLASLQAWSLGSFGDGAGGWQVSGRKSSVDLGQVSPLHDSRDPHYLFSDLVGRVDTPVGRRARIVLSGMYSGDQNGDVDAITDGSATKATNALGVLRIEAPVGGVKLIQRVGISRYDANFADANYKILPADRTRQTLQYVTAAGEIVADSTSGWRFGYDVVHQTSRFNGSRPWPYEVHLRGMSDTTWSRVSDRVGAWVERRALLFPSVEFQGSLRLSRPLEDRRESLLLPSVLLRYSPATKTSLSVGAARYEQNAQSPAAITSSINGPLSSARVWMLSPDPVDARIVTLGIERWVGESWLLSGTLYRRNARSVLLPNPEEGMLSTRSAIATGSVLSTGVEATARRLAGRITGSMSYSFGSTTADVADIRFHPPTDRRHLVDAAVRLSVTDGMRLTTTYSFASGAPYARIYDGGADGSCASRRCEDVESITFVDDPFGRRSPAYSSLDLALDWTRSFRGWAIGLFVQIQNALQRENAVTYYATVTTCPDAPKRPDETCPKSESGVPVDRFITGLDPLPLIGMRVAF